MLSEFGSVQEAAAYVDDTVMYINDLAYRLCLPGGFTGRPSDGNVFEIEQRFIEEYRLKERILEKVNKTDRYVVIFEYTSDGSSATMFVEDQHVPVRYQYLVKSTGCRCIDESGMIHDVNDV